MACKSIHTLNTLRRRHIIKCVKKKSFFFILTEISIHWVFLPSGITSNSVVDYKWHRHSMITDEFVFQFSCNTWGSFSDHMGVGWGLNRRLFNQSRKCEICYLSGPPHKDERKRDHDAAESHPENHVWVPEHVQVSCEKTETQIQRQKHFKEVENTQTLLSTHTYPEEWKGQWRRRGSPASGRPRPRRPWLSRIATSSSPGGRRPPRPLQQTLQGGLQGDTPPTALVSIWTHEDRTEGRRASYHRNPAVWSLWWGQRKRTPRSWIPCRTALDAGREQSY